MSLDQELDDLVAEPEPPGPTNVQRAMSLVPTIVELSQKGFSKHAICEKLGLAYAVICRAEKKNTTLYEAFRGIPPAAGDVPNVVAFSRKLEEDPASPENLKRIQTWARDGVSRGSQAALLKMTEEQFAGYVKNVPRVADAIRMGEAEAEAAACAALSALARDPEHKDHIRAVLAQVSRSTAVKPKDDEEPEELLTPEQIRAALAKPARS